MLEFFLLVAAAGLAALYLSNRELSRRLSAIESHVKTLETTVALLEANRPIATNTSPEQPLDRPAEPASDAPVDRANTPSESIVGADEHTPAQSPMSSPDVSPPSVPPMPPPPSARDPAPAPASPNFEERLGTKWAVYIGGAAIALGGVFLVKHAIDIGLLGPAARIVLGLILGFGLIAAGTLMRSGSVTIASAPPSHAPHIPSVLTAAGTVVLFATVYAAHALYGFIDSGVAFLLLAAVGIGTIYAATLHGPALAALGLAASFATPILIATEHPNPWALVIFLAVISTSALWLSHLKSWYWLTTSTVVGNACWTLIMISAPLQSNAVWTLPLMIHLLAQTTIGAAIWALIPHFTRNDETTEPNRQTIKLLGTLAILAVMAVLAVPNAHWFHQIFAWAMISLLTATAYLVLPASPAYLFAGLIVLSVMIGWPGIGDPITPRYTLGSADGVIRLPEHILAFITFALTAGGLVAAPATYTLWQRRARSATTVGVIASAATIIPLALLTIAYLRITQFGTDIGVSAAGAALALLFATLTDRFERREPAPAGMLEKIPTGAFATAAIAALAIALIASLQRGYLTVAFALAALGTAYISTRRDIPILRHVVAALGFIVLARIIWDPLIMGEDLGPLPVFNGLLIGYGIPAACFATATVLLHKVRSDIASEISAALAILFTALLGIFEIRHYIHNGNPLALTTGHLEMGLTATLMLTISFVLWRLNNLHPSRIFESARAVASTISLLIIVLGLWIAYNPVFTNEPIAGGVPLSTLLPAYLLPGLLALFIARQTMNEPPEWYSRAAASVALLLIFAYVTLEVRHAYQGPFTSLFQRTGDAELWTYTAAWLILAIIWLAYGLVRQSLPARAASGILLAITIAKVALFDLRDIEGIWRALSFLCLGGVLIAIGIVYQKLIFSRPLTPKD